MTKIKFRLSSWEKGELFMQTLASALDIKIETHDAKQVIELSEGKVTFQPDDRGFAFITVKNVNQETEELVRKFQEKFSSEE